MSAAPRRPRRWLVALLALLVLVSGEGFHELSHAEFGARTSHVPSGQVEVHGSNCPHQPRAPHHDRHECLLCQHRAALDSLALPEAVVTGQPLRAVARCRELADVARTSCVPGILGARGPPLTPA